MGFVKQRRFFTRVTEVFLCNTSRSVDFGTGICKQLQRTEFLGLWANDGQISSTTLTLVLGIHVPFCVNMEPLFDVKCVGMMFIKPTPKRALKSNNTFMFG